MLPTRLDLAGRARTVNSSAVKLRHGEAVEKFHCDGDATCMDNYE
mgnify:CR=1 FL=1